MYVYIVYAPVVSSRKRNTSIRMDTAYNVMDTLLLLCWRSKLVILSISYVCIVFVRRWGVLSFAELVVGDESLWLYGGAR